MEKTYTQCPSQTGETKNYEQHGFIITHCLACNRYFVGSIWSSSPEHTTDGRIIYTNLIGQNEVTVRDRIEAIPAHDHDQALAIALEMVHRERCASYLMGNRTVEEIYRFLEGCDIPMSDWPLKAFIVIAERDRRNAIRERERQEDRVIVMDPIAVS